MAKSKGLEDLASTVLDLFVAGMDRGAIVAQVRQMEKDGAPPEAITAALREGRKQSETDLQDKIDQMPE